MCGPRRTERRMKTSSAVLMPFDVRRAATRPLHEIDCVVASIGRVMAVCLLRGLKRRICPPCGCAFTSFDATQPTSASPTGGIRCK
jgi:hypothetical protein